MGTLQLQVPFREQALARLTAAFGKPTVVQVAEGEIYRWVLARPFGVDLHVTLDSPEFPDLAHLIVSDPKAGPLDPIASLTMRTLPEVDAVVERLLLQWKQ